MSTWKWACDRFDKQFSTLFTCEGYRPFTLNIMFPGKVSTLSRKHFAPFYDAICLFLENHVVVDNEDSVTRIDFVMQLKWLEQTRFASWKWDGIHVVLRMNTKFFGPLSWNPGKRFGLRINAEICLRNLFYKMFCGDTADYRWQDATYHCQCHSTMAMKRYSLECRGHVWSAMQIPIEVRDMHEQAKARQRALHGIFAPQPGNILGRCIGDVKDTRLSSTQQCRPPPYQHHEEIMTCYGNQGSNLNYNLKPVSDNRVDASYIPPLGICRYEGPAVQPLAFGVLGTSGRLTLSKWGAVIPADDDGLPAIQRVLNNLKK